MLLPEGVASKRSTILSAESASHWLSESAVRTEVRRCELCALVSLFSLTDTDDFVVLQDTAITTKEAMRRK